MFILRSTKLNLFYTNYPRDWFYNTLWSIESTTGLNPNLSKGVVGKVQNKEGRESGEKSIRSGGSNPRPIAC